MKYVAIVMVALMVCVMAFGNVAQAQLYRVTNIVFQNKQLANTAKDSVVGFPIEYTGNTYPALQGAIPDSIRFEHFCNADSVYAIDIYLKIKYGENASYGRKQLDSIVSTTALVTIGGITLNSRDYAGANSLGIAVTARAATSNAAITATASKFTLKETRYFRK
jgi:hypothetical protein